MVRLRLTRTGHKNLPSFRVVAVPLRAKRETKFLEFLGNYSPISKEVNFNEERVKYWLSVGAQPSDTVAALLVKANLLDKKALPTKKYANKPGRKSSERTAKKSEKAEAAKAAAEAPKEEVVVVEETPATEEVVAEVTEAPEAADQTEAAA